MMDGLELICATTVPFDASGDLDARGMRHLFEGIRASGIRSVFTPGTTGEFTALTHAERRAVIDCALDVFTSDGVYAHVGAATPREAAALARAADAAGARKLAAITPYFVTAGPLAVEDYYRQIASAAPGCAIYVYVFKDRATTDVSPDLMARLATIPGVAGAKLSGMSSDRVERYMRATPRGFRVCSGNDRDLVRLARAGVAAIVSGISGVFPAPFVAAVGAIARGEDASGFQPVIDAVCDAVEGGNVALLKAGLEMQHLPAGPLRVALEPATPAQLARLGAQVAQMQVRTAR